MTEVPLAHRRMLAVAFGPPGMDAALRQMPSAVEQADCIELRLDLMTDGFDLPQLLRARGEVPVVVTLRPPEQGGKCPLPFDERLAVLLRAAELGAEYVDLEFDAATPDALRALRARGARVVISRHDFERMPTGFADEWWPRLAELDADVVKIVGTALDARDCLPVLRALRQADRPTIAIAMGEAGQPSRILALREGQCFLTYASLAEGTATAPGQLTISDMRTTFCAEGLSTSTRVFGLLGPHAERERLVEYNAWLGRDGRDAVCVPFVASSDAAAIVRAYRDLPVSGWHVHGLALQTDVASALDELRSLNGRANSIVRDADGTLRGAWVESPNEQYELWRAAS